MKKHKINKADKKKLIDDIAACLERECPDIKAAYLFGSILSNGPFGDIDVGLLMESIPRDVLSYELNIENMLERYVRFPVDIRVLNGAPLAFRYNVIKQQHILVDRDPMLRADFESGVLRQYFDFVPFQKRYLAEVINAPL